MVEAALFVSPPEQETKSCRYSDLGVQTKRCRSAGRAEPRTAAGRTLSSRSQQGKPWERAGTVSLRAQHLPLFSSASWCLRPRHREQPPLLRF